MSENVCLPQLSGFSQEELLISNDQECAISNDQKYKILFDRYQNLQNAHEKDAQQIYELRRNLQTASAAEAYLSQELESIMSAQITEIEKIKQKHNLEIEELKEKYLELESQNVFLERTVEELKTENESLQLKIGESQKLESNLLGNASLNDCAEKDLKLENENFDLLAKVDEFQEKVNKSVLLIAERERQIEILKEHLQCLEENLQSKRDEVEEKTLLLEGAQEQVIELNAELAVLKSTPENENRKGNSLFAEVDDQRQAMKKILAAQKKHYLEMRKIYNESEHEIRRLKRENSSMYKELELCSSIFLNADKVYKEKLNERIVQLLKRNDDLEKKNIWTQDKLIDLSNSKGINWLDSMLSFCKNETKELKEQLYSCRLQKSLLDENLRNSQQELAKWRFEALKSRCIIIKRETLLEENKIPFENMISAKCHITEEDYIAAKPQIIIGQHEFINTSPRDYRESNEFTTGKSIQNSQINIKTQCTEDIQVHENSFPNFPKNENLMDGKSTSKTDDYKTEEKKIGENIVEHFQIYEDTTMNFPKIELNKNCNSLAQKKFKDILVESKTKPYLNDYKFNKDVGKTEESNYKSGELGLESLEKENMIRSFDATIKNQEQAPASILLKKRDILCDENDNKSVRFNEMEIACHNLSIGEQHEQTRTKSNVVVKRIVLKKK